MKYISKDTVEKKKSCKYILDFKYSSLMQIVRKKSQTEISKEGKSFLYLYSKLYEKCCSNLKTNFFFIIMQFSEIDVQRIYSIFP